MRVLQFDLKKTVISLHPTLLICTQFALAIVLIKYSSSMIRSPKLSPYSHLVSFYSSSFANNFSPTFTTSLNSKKLLPFKRRILHHHSLSLALSFPMSTYHASPLCFVLLISPLSTTSLSPYLAPSPSITS